MARLSRSRPDAVDQCRQRVTAGFLRSGGEDLAFAWVEPPRTNDFGHVDIGGASISRTTVAGTSTLAVQGFDQIETADAREGDEWRAVADPDVNHALGSPELHPVSLERERRRQRLGSA